MRAMNGRDWIRRHSAATTVAPERNGAGPAEALRSGELAGDGRTMAALVPERELDALLGRTLGVAVPAGAPLPRAALGGRAAGTAAFTLVLPALHALAGQLAPGDRVSVLATYGGSGQARTKAVARGLEVLSVGSAPSGIDSAAA